MGNVGGKREGAGRKKNSKNRKTIEREKAEQLERERQELARKATDSALEIDKAVGSQHKLLKDVGSDMARLAAGLAAFYQPYPNWTRDANGKLHNANPNYDEARFRYYIEIAMQGARDFAAFESPKLSAVLVNQQVVNHIRVEGGMPDEFTAPAASEVEFKPGDIISAEDGVADSKVVDGEIIPLKVVGR